MKIRKGRTRRPAFTLMEMMVVVAIIVALAGISIIYYAGQVDEGNKAKARAGVTSLDTAVGMYKAARPELGANWPTSLDVLLVRDEQGRGPYLTNSESLVDPWGNPYQYDPAGPRNNTIKPDIYCVIPNSGLIIGNWSTRISK